MTFLGKLIIIYYIKVPRASSPNETARSTKTQALALSYQNFFEMSRLRKEHDVKSLLALVSQWFYMRTVFMSGGGLVRPRLRGQRPRFTGAAKAPPGLERPPSGEQNGAARAGARLSGPRAQGPVLWQRGPLAAGARAPDGRGPGGAPGGRAAPQGPTL